MRPSPHGGEGLRQGKENHTALFGNSGIPEFAEVQPTRRAVSVGLRPEREAYVSALEGVDISRYFLGLDREALLALLSE